MAEGERDTKESEVSQYFIRKYITKLFKTFLDINEEIKSEHEIMLDKVESKTSEEFAQNIDYFTPAKSEYFRKKILDNGNECIREITAFIDVFDLKVNEKKLEKILNSKTIVKKDFGGVTYSRNIRE